MEREEGGGRGGGGRVRESQHMDETIIVCMCTHACACFAREVDGD